MRVVSYSRQELTTLLVLALPCLHGKPDFKVEREFPAS